MNRVALLGICIFAICGCQSTSNSVELQEFLDFYRPLAGRLQASYSELRIKCVEVAASRGNRSQVVTGWLTRVHRCLNERSIDETETKVENFQAKDSGGDLSFLYGTNDRYQFAIRSQSNPNDNAYNWSIDELSIGATNGPKYIIQCAIGDSFRRFWFAEIADDPRIRVTAFEPSKLAEFHDAWRLGLEIALPKSDVRADYYLDKNDGRCLGFQSFRKGQVASRTVLKYATSHDIAGMPTIESVDFLLPDGNGGFYMERQTRVISMELLANPNWDETKISFYGFPEPPSEKSWTRTRGAIIALIAVVLGMAFVGWRKIARRTKR